MEQERRSEVSSESIRDTIIRELKVLRGILAQVKDTSDLRSLLPLLADLQTHLASHFKTEEADEGFFIGTKMKAPHLSHRLDHCLQEHCEISSTLAELTERLEACLTGPMVEIHKRKEKLLKLISKHEAEENEILNDSINIDMGGGD